MKNFKGGNKFRGGERRGGFSGGHRAGFGGGRDGGERELFDAICAECGKPCQVPFRPNGQKPVYCRDCFGGKEGPSRDTFSRDDRGFRPERSGMQHETKVFQAQPNDRKIDELKRQLDVVQSKLDELIKMVERSQKTAKTSGEASTSPAQTLSAQVQEITAEIEAKKTKKKKGGVKK